MAPDISADYLSQLIAAGLSQREIARRTGIPRATLQDRLKRLGLQVTPPVQSAVQDAVQLHRSSAEPLAVQSAVQTLQGDVEALKAQMSALAKVVQGLAERPAQSAVQSTVQITALPPMPPSKSTRWNLWLPTILQEEISRIATERGIPPSQLVKEWLWEKLQPLLSSTP
jgi:hypothetical protein